MLDRDLIFYIFEIFFFIWSSECVSDLLKDWVSFLVRVYTFLHSEIGIWEAVLFVAMKTRTKDFSIYRDVYQLNISGLGINRKLFIGLNGPGSWKFVNTLN